MSGLMELSRRMAELETQMAALEMCDSPEDYDGRVMRAARLALLRSAWQRVSREYHGELARTSTADLLAITERARDAHTKEQT